MTEGTPRELLNDQAELSDAREEARAFLQVRGQDFVVWGLFIASGYLGAYAILTEHWHASMNWLWAICIGLPLLFSLRGVIAARLGFPVPKAQYSLTALMQQVWWICALAQITLFISGNLLVRGMPMGWFVPVSAAIIGIDFLLTAWICDLLLLRYIGYAWMGATVIFFSNLWSVNQALYGAAAMLAMMAVTGLRLIFFPKSLEMK